MVHALGYEFYVVVDNYHRVVYNHAERYDEAGEGHSV